MCAECLARNGQLNTFSLKSGQRHLCLICQETALKEDISCHFSTKHANDATNRSMQANTAIAQRTATKNQAELFMAFKLTEYLFFASLTFSFRLRLLNRQLFLYRPKNEVELWAILPRFGRSRWYCRYRTRTVLTKKIAN